MNLVLNWHVDAPLVQRLSVEKHFVGFGQKSTGSDGGKSCTWAVM
jgi:hypothetical protein